MIRVDDGDIPTTDQYAAMLDAAAAGSYAYPAVNVTSSQTLNAAIRCFAYTGSDGIVEVTPELMAATDLVPASRPISGRVLVVRAGMRQITRSAGC